MHNSAQGRKELPFEGLSAHEILALPIEQIDALMLTGEPIVFRVGSATALGEFRREHDRLIVELAHIEGGGGGALISIWSLVRRYARLQSIEVVEWIGMLCTVPSPTLS